MLYNEHDNYVGIRLGEAIASGSLENVHFIENTILVEYIGSRIN